MRRILHILLLLVFVGTGLFFGSLNRTETHVDFFFFTVDWPLALALAAFFFAGALLGGLVTWIGGWFANRRRIKAMRAELREALRVEAPGQAMVPAGAAGQPAESSTTGG